jgi:chorismate mutase
MICAQEVPVPGSLPLCIRVLLHVVMRDTDSRLTGVYLGKAVQLRPDIASPGN